MKILYVLCCTLFIVAYITYGQQTIPSGLVRHTFSDGRTSLLSDILDSMVLTNHVGDINVDGEITANKFIGDGSGLVNLNISSDDIVRVGIAFGASNTVYYNTDNTPLSRRPNVHCIIIGEPERVHASIVITDINTTNFTYEIRTTGLPANEGWVVQYIVVE